MAACGQGSGEGAGERCGTLEVHTRAVGTAHAAGSPLEGALEGEAEGVSLEREPDNRADANAIVVSVGGAAAGHVPARVAEVLAPLMDGGEAVEVAAARVLAPPPGRASRLGDLALTLRVRSGRADVAALAAAHAEPVTRALLDDALWRELDALARAVFGAAPHLATDEDRAAWARLAALDAAPRRLAARLLNRTRPGRWFRPARVACDELERPDEAAAALAAGGVARSTDGELGAADVCELLPELGGAQLRALARGLGRRPASSDAVGAVRSSLLAHLTGQRTLSGRPLAGTPQTVRAVRAAAGRWIRLDAALVEFVRRARLLFFLGPRGGPRDDDERRRLAQMLRAGLVRFNPHYRVPPDPYRAVFPTRAALLEYERARAALAAVEDAADVAAAAEAGREALRMARAAAVAARDAPRPAHPALSPLWVLAGACHAAVPVLEREGLHAEAVAFLRALLGRARSPSGRAMARLRPWPRRRGAWWNRLALNLATHLRRPGEALDEAREGLRDPAVRTGSLVELRARAARLHRRCAAGDGGPPSGDALAAAAEERLVRERVREERIEARPSNCRSGEKSRFFGLGHESAIVTVEELALQHFAADGGWEGEHAENRLVATLVGLLMWDVRFDSDVPGAFVTPHQDAPLDAGTAAYYEARRGAVDARAAELAELDRAGLDAELAAVWRRHRGRQARGVHWDAWPLERLQELAWAFGPFALAAVCHARESDSAAWSGGLPDLFLWRSGDEAMLCEVKGPNDRLSPQQRAWLAFFARVSRDAEAAGRRAPLVCVLRVSLPGSKAGSGSVL